MHCDRRHHLWLRRQGLVLVLVVLLPPPLLLLLRRRPCLWRWRRTVEHGGSTSTSKLHSVRVALLLLLLLLLTMRRRRWCWNPVQSARPLQLAFDRRELAFDQRCDQRGRGGGKGAR